jgi:tetratricopeptide (TPR) repeat protein
LYLLYIALQEPEEAISSYREALKLTGNTDSVIARKIGSAMVKTHNYRGAIDYYEASVKKGSAHVLRVDLANLYVKLRLYPNARKVIDAGLAHDRSSADLDHLKADVKLHMASAALATAQEPPDATAAIEDLMKAKEAQRVVLRRVIQEQPDALARENAMMPTLCMSIAEHYVKQGEKERAVGFYDEALRFDPDCVDALISVSRLYLSMPDRLDDAVAQLDRTLDLQPYVAEWCFFLPSSVAFLSFVMRDSLSP